MPQIVSPERTIKANQDRTKSNSSANGKKRSNSTNKIVGALIAILLFVSVAKMFTAKPKAPSKPTVRVVAAAKNILPGVRVGFSDVRYLTMPQDYANEAMFTKKNDVVGRISTMFIPAKNPIQTSFLHGHNKTLSNSLENHERAVTVKLSEEALVDHQLFPGDRVDILCTSQKDGDKYTKTICKNIKVLMSSTRDMLQTAGANSRAQNRITLAVLPNEAELLSHAEQVGKVKLIMRNRLATNTPTVHGVGQDDLLPESALTKASSSGFNLGSIPAPPPEPEAIMPDLPPEPPSLQNTITEPLKSAAGWVVEVFSGSNKNTYEFPNAPLSE